MPCSFFADFGHAEGFLGLKARGSSVHAEAHRSEATLILSVSFFIFNQQADELAMIQLGLMGVPKAFRQA